VGFEPLGLGQGVALGTKVDDQLGKVRVGPTFGSQGRQVAFQDRDRFGDITTLPTTVIIGRNDTVLAAFKGVPAEGSLEAFVDEALSLRP